MARREAKNVRPNLRKSLGINKGFFRPGERFPFDQRAQNRKVASYRLGPICGLTLPTQTG
jgi:hypothetical protein